MQTVENVRDIAKMKSDIVAVEKQMAEAMNQLNDVVTKSDLADMMEGFAAGTDNGLLMYNAQYCSADLAYASIYSQARLWHRKI